MDVYYYHLASLYTDNIAFTATWNQNVTSFKVDACAVAESKMDISFQLYNLIYM